MTVDLRNARIWAEKTHGTESIGNICKVADSMRFCALRGIKLRSDRQPRAIFVINIPPDNPEQYAPMVVAEDRPDGAASIRVTIDGSHWARLAYQFGHELGHVLANSWGTEAIPAPPCQWIEEVCVEALSLRSLFEVALRWALKPPNLDWKWYAPHFVEYAEMVLREYCELPQSRNAELDQLVNLGTTAKVLVPNIAAAFRDDRRLIEDIAALNRWPGRSSVPFDDYLALWRTSCSEIGTPGRLPELFAAIR